MSTTVKSVSGNAAAWPPCEFEGVFLMDEDIDIFSEPTPPAEDHSDDHDQSQIKFHVTLPSKCIKGFKKSCVIAKIHGKIRLYKPPAGIALHFRIDPDPEMKAEDFECLGNFIRTTNRWLLYLEQKARFSQRSPPQPPLRRSEPIDIPGKPRAKLPSSTEESIAGPPSLSTDYLFLRFGI